MPAAGRGSRAVPAADGAVAGARFAELPLDAITPNPLQPRTHFDEEALAELVHSIREVGLLQPVVVRATAPGRYELVMGERRWRASQEAGTGTIPAIVRETGDDAMLRDALLENLHRPALNPLEEAAAYAQLLEDFGATHEELASRHRPLAPADLQHDPPAAAAAGGAAAGGRRRAQRRARPRDPRPADARRRRRRWRPASSPRGCRCAGSRRPWRSAVAGVRRRARAALARAADRCRRA